MSLLLQINDCQLVKLQQNPEYMTRPKLVKIYDINYTRFSPAKKFRYLFKEPSQYPLDLNNVVGDPIEIKHSTQNNLLHPLLNTYFEDYIVLLEEDIDDDDNRNANKVEMTDVYSRRGILERIMGFYYEKNDFSALVSRCNGKLFVVELPQSEDAFERNQSGNNTHHRRFCQITSVDTMPELSDCNDDNIFQVAIHEANLGKYNLHYVARAPAIKVTEASKNDLKNLRDVEFVSTKQMWSSIRDKSTKFLKYWLQSYLSNVRELYIAYKDSKGMVSSPIECWKTCDIPKNYLWKPRVCTTFLNEFLNKVEEIMANINSLDIVFEFAFNTSTRSVTYFKKSGVGFIPKEYADRI
ncbi:decapping nuclease DXO homolog [Musca domestica]|uniref:Decapping nuclease n=1 Tax=Musca domestica TaxID=7370 RepID=A0A9J7CXH1_MUSDO|nr:decapping nuclease DXO homolog [Musca domestica]